MSSPHHPPDQQLPADAAWLFPEYEFGSMTLASHRGVIIERILERGTWDQTRWLFRVVGETAVAEWVGRHGYRLLSRRSFALWRLVRGVRVFDAPDWAIEAKAMEAW